MGATVARPGQRQVHSGDHQRAKDYSEGDDGGSKAVARPGYETLILRRVLRHRRAQSWVSGRVGTFALRNSRFWDDRRDWWAHDTLLVNIT